MGPCAVLFGAQAKSVPENVQKESTLHGEGMNILHHPIPVMWISPTFTQQREHSHVQQLVHFSSLKSVTDSCVSIRFERMVLLSLAGRGEKH